MRLNCRLITNESNRFVPSRVFKKKRPEDKIWMKVNNGKYPPIEVDRVNTPSDYLGIDGQYISLEINPHSVRIRKREILSIEQFDLYVSEVIEC